MERKLRSMIRVYSSPRTVKSLINLHIGHKMCECVLKIFLEPVSCCFGSDLFTFPVLMSYLLVKSWILLQTTSYTISHSFLYPALPRTALLRMYLLLCAMLIYLMVLNLNMLYTERVLWPHITKRERDDVRHDGEDCVFLGVGACYVYHIRAIFITWHTIRSCRNRRTYRRKSFCALSKTL